jgi:hypothetical protein
MWALEGDVPFLHFSVFSMYYKKRTHGMFFALIPIKITPIKHKK